jgi:hypothetical protein
VRPEIFEALEVTGLTFVVRADRAAALELVGGGRRVSRITRLARRLLRAERESPPKLVGEGRRISRLTRLTQRALSPGGSPGQPRARSASRSPAADPHARAARARDLLKSDGDPAAGQPPPTTAEPSVPTAPGAGAAFWARLAQRWRR